MRIGFIGAEGVPYPAAFARYTEEVGSRLARRGHQVVVWSRAHCVADTSDYRGMKRVVCPSADTKHLDTITSTLLATLDAMRLGADVLHFHGIGPSIWAILPRARGVKTVVQVHALDWQRAKWGRVARTYLRSAEYSSVYFPNATVAISRTLKRYLEGKFHGPVHYIPGGVDVGEPRPPDQIRGLGLAEGRYLLFVSRLVPEKGLHYLLRAFSQLDTDMKLVVVGEGRHSDGYVSELRGMADGRVVWTGRVSQELLDELFSNAYLFVQPSDVEGLAAAPLQAMSLGGCVVSSDIPENREAIGEWGYTFRKGDSDDLRDLLARLLAAPELVGRMREPARRYVAENYSWDRVTDALESLYLALARSQGSVTSPSAGGR